MNLKEFLLLTHYTKPLFDNMRPSLLCRDGFKMSIQAGKGYFCEPREDCPQYKSVEIGYPDYDDILAIFISGSLEQYREEINYYVHDPLNDVLDRVPVELVQKVIDKHKGIDDQNLFDRIKSATKYNLRGKNDFS